MFVLRGVLIIIKLIDAHIGHSSSVGVRFCEEITNISHRPCFSRRLIFVRSSLDGGLVTIVFLVLVFAATRSEMALRSVLLIQIGKRNVEIIYI